MRFDASAKTKMFWEVYARYFLASQSIYYVCEKLHLESPTILEIGANGEQYLNEFLPDAIVIPSNMNPENLNKTVDNLVVADASDMHMIPDNSYDFVISCAVLEHIPPKLHRAVLSETFRVARIGVFHAAPLESEYVNRAERTVSNFHEQLHKVKHRWIEEHLINGHPSVEAISSYCRELGMDYSIFQHMDYQLWTSLYCTTLETGRYGGRFREYINVYYQQELFHRDAGKFNVFMYLYMSKSGPVADEVFRDFRNGLQEADRELLLSDFYDFQKHLQFMVSSSKEEAIGNQLKNCEQNSDQVRQLLEKNKNIAHALERYIQECENSKKICAGLKNDVQILKKQNLQLSSDLKAIKQSTSWKLTKPLRSFGDFIRGRHDAAGS